MRRTGLAGGICSRKIKLGSDPPLFLSSNHATRRCTNFEGFGHTNSWEIIMGGRIYPDADPQATIVWFLPFSLATTRCTPLYIGNDFAFVLLNIKATLINIVHLHRFTKEIQACVQCT